MNTNRITDEELRKTDWDLVVIGRGYASLANCATRFHAQALPENTLLVGQADPWITYAEHPMGQYPTLLAIPGFSEAAQPRECSPKEFLSSSRFAAQNSRQISWLCAKASLRQVDSVIESPLEFVSGHWMIPLTRDNNKVTLRARNVDICTGPGPMRIFAPGGGHIYGPWSAGIRDSFDPALLQEIRDGVGKRALVAETFMTHETANAKVLVVGEGALAASVVEHALRCGAKEVYWVGRPTQIPASFPPSLRYDGLVKNANEVRDCGARMNLQIDNGERVDVKSLIDVLVPTDSRLTIILGAISCVSSNSVTLISDSNFSIFTATALEQNVLPAGEPQSLAFDTIVVSASSQNNESERQSAAHLLKSIPKSISSKGLQAISYDAMFVGLKVEDETLRVLGAAARNPFLVNRYLASSSENAEYINWHDSLCAQARMPDYAMGITVGAATIAMANQYYSDTHPDICAQTARLPKCALRTARESRPTPFEPQELASTKFQDFPRAN